MPSKALVLQGMVEEALDVRSSMIYLFGPLVEILSLQPSQAAPPSQTTILSLAFNEAPLLAALPAFRVFDMPSLVEVAGYSSRHRQVN